MTDPIPVLRAEQAPAWLELGNLPENISREDAESLLRERLAGLIDYVDKAQQEVMDALRTLGGWHHGRMGGSSESFDVYRLVEMSNGSVLRIFMTYHRPSMGHTQPKDNAIAEVLQRHELVDDDSDLIPFALQRAQGGMVEYYSADTVDAARHAASDDNSLEAVIRRCRQFDSYSQICPTTSLFMGSDPAKTVINWAQHKRFENQVTSFSPTREAYETLRDIDADLAYGETGDDYISDALSILRKLEQAMIATQVGNHELVSDYVDDDTVSEILKAAKVEKLLAACQWSIAQLEHIEQNDEVYTAAIQRSLGNESDAYYEDCILEHEIRSIFDQLPPNTETHEYIKKMRHHQVNQEVVDFLSPADLEQYVKLLDSLRHAYMHRNRSRIAGHFRRVLGAKEVRKADVEHVKKKIQESGNLEALPYITCIDSAARKTRSNMRTRAEAVERLVHGESTAVDAGQTQMDIECIIHSVKREFTQKIIGHAVYIAGVADELIAEKISFVRQEGGEQRIVGRPIDGVWNEGVVSVLNEMLAAFTDQQGPTDHDSMLSNLALIKTRLAFLNGIVSTPEVSASSRLSIE